MDCRLLCPLRFGSESHRKIDPEVRSRAEGWAHKLKREALVARGRPHRHVTGRARSRNRRGVGFAENSHEDRIPSLVVTCRCETFQLPRGYRPKLRRGAAPKETVALNGHGPYSRRLVNWTLRNIFAVETTLLPLPISTPVRWTTRHRPHRADAARLLLDETLNNRSGLRWNPSCSRFARLFVIDLLYHFQIKKQCIRKVGIFA